MLIQSDLILRSPDALTVSALTPIADPCDLPRSASLHSEPSRRLPPLRPTPRYYAVVDHLFQYRLLLDRQIQLALFSPGNASGCQRTLTRLVRHRWIGHLPRRSVSEPYIYLLTSRSTVGNRLMREKYGEKAFRHQMFRPGAIDHLLAVNELRIRLALAHDCAILDWRRAEELPAYLGSDRRLIPDAYARIQHGGRVVGLFLETQRALKSHRVLISKLERYRALFQTPTFAGRSIRVLVVFTSYLGRTSDDRTASALRAIDPIRYPFVRLASLEAITAVSPESLASSSVFYCPGQGQPFGLLGVVGGGPTP